MSSSRTGAVRRVSVVGVSGSGKSTLARRLAARLDVPYLELDSIHHLAGWEPIAPELFRERAGEIAATPGWVVDGNYGQVTRDGPIWELADTVVWLDLQKSTVMRQVIGRTLRRLTTREELWNTNRERWGNLFRWDPEHSVIRWSWTTYAPVVERYEAAMTDDRYAHLRFVRLRSHDEADDWLSSVE